MLSSCAGEVRQGSSRRYELCPIEVKEGLARFLVQTSVRLLHFAQAHGRIWTLQPKGRTLGRNFPGALTGASPSVCIRQAYPDSLICFDLWTKACCWRGGYVGERRASVGRPGDPHGPKGARRQHSVQGKTTLGHAWYRPFWATSRDTSPLSDKLGASPHISRATTFACLLGPTDRAGFCPRARAPGLQPRAAGRARGGTPSRKKSKRAHIAHGSIAVVPRRHPVAMETPLPPKAREPVQPRVVRPRPAPARPRTRAKAAGAP